MGKDATRIRTVCYVDGFNLYHGLREAGLRHCYWLNIRKMAAALLKPPYVLKHTKYFTARVSGGRKGDSPAKAADREGSRIRQTAFLEALETLEAFNIYEGRFLLKPDSCRACGANFLRAEEKATDVRLACELVADAFLNVFDSAVIVSADSDLAPPIDIVRRRKPLYQPPTRFKHCPGWRHVPLIDALRGADHSAQAASTSAEIQFAGRGFADDSGCVDVGIGVMIVVAGH